MGETQRIFLEMARERDVPLVAAPAQPWLSGDGHLNPLVVDQAPQTVRVAIAAVYRRLGGDEEGLAGQKRRPTLRPDFLHEGTRYLVELDEIRHFTSDRAVALELYPNSVPLGFDLALYTRLIGQYSSKADRYRHEKTAANFPSPGGRRAQRAFFDALRDLLAPTFTGQPLMRVHAPECDPSLAFERFRELQAGWPDVNRS